MSTERLKKFFYLFKRMYGKYSLQVFLLIGLSIFNGLIGSLGISTLIPLFSYVSEGRISGDDPISRGFSAIFQYFHLIPSLRVLLITVISLFLLKAIILAIFSYLKTSIAISYELHMRRKLYAKALWMKWSYLSSQKLGYLNDVIIYDVGSLSALLKQFATFSLNLSSFVIYTATAVSISPFVASATMGFGLLSILLLKPFMGKLLTIGQEGNLTKKEIAHQINENILGAKTIKIMGVERVLSEATNKLFYKLRDLAFRFRKMRIIIDDPVEPLSMIFITVLFAVSFLRPGFELAAFLVAIYLIKNILDYVDKMRDFAMAANGMIPNIQRVIQLQNELEEYPEENSGVLEFKFEREFAMKGVRFIYNKNILDYVDKMRDFAMAANGMIPNIQRVIQLQNELEEYPEENSGVLEFKFEREFAMKGVRFIYNKNSGYVLDGINLSIKRGEMAGIIGVSGAGKTTLADLILRLFLPSSGEILLDGKDIRNIKLESWRKNIGYVAQDIFLKNDTIENNIRFYDPDISDADILEAAEMAQCFDFIDALPKGIKSKVGERGAMLSGGQRQRIALARAIARRPKLLILDEATSSIDNPSEILIKKAIEGIKGKMTIIIIAHRLSTIMDADKLFYLEKGRVIEEGSPRQLLSDPDSHFSKMHNVKT